MYVLVRDRGKHIPHRLVCVVVPRRCKLSEAGTKTGRRCTNRQQQKKKGAQPNTHR